MRKLIRALGVTLVLISTAGCLIVGPPGSEGPQGPGGYPGGQGGRPAGPGPGHPGGQPMPPQSPGVIIVP